MTRHSMYQPSISYVEPNTLVSMVWDARTMSTLVKVHGMYGEFNRKQMKRIANKIIRQHGDDLFYDGYKLSKLLQEEIVVIAMTQWLKA